MSGLVLRALAWLIGLLPFTALPRLGDVLAFLVCDVLRIRRAHVQSALARASVSIAPREVYCQLGTSLLELLWLSARPDADLGPLVRIEGLERFEVARALGRGVIVATAHTGNWDLAACACATRARLSVVTKRLSSRSVDAFWQETRRARGVDLVPAPDGGVVQALTARLSAGGAVALLVDQDPERTTSVVSAPFLGAIALHDALPATLSARTGSPIVVAFARRAADGHVVEIVDVIEAPVGRGSIAAATRRIAAALDAYVRAAPATWLWLHRRWKTQLDAPRRTSALDADAEILHRH